MGCAATTKAIRTKAEGLSNSGHTNLTINKVNFLCVCVSFSYLIPQLVSIGMQMFECVSSGTNNCDVSTESMFVVLFYIFSEKTLA